MGILKGNPAKEPLHYGEVYGIWSYLSTAKSVVSGYQTLINHTGDKDLKRFLEDIIQNVLKREIEETENILKINGVELPPTPPERSTANLESIPPGARFTDPEIAMRVSADITIGLMACSQNMGLSVREDIGMMFANLHSKKAQYGSTLLRMLKEKGWLVSPPLLTNVPEPANV